MKILYLLIVFECTFRIGFCEVNLVINPSEHIAEAFALLGKNSEFSSKTVEVTISEGDKTVQNTQIIDFDLSRGLYKMVSVSNNPQSINPNVGSLFVGDLLTAYTKVNDKTSPWSQLTNLVGVGNRIHAIVSQMQFTSSPIIQELSKTFSDDIHLYNTTDQLDKLPQYTDALKELKDKNGFSISTDTHQAHCVVDKSGIITHLDCEIDAGSFFLRYNMDVKVIPNIAIDFPPLIVTHQPTDFAAKIKDPIYGFTINVVNGIPTILYAIPGSSYVKAGGHTGDRVLKVNDISLQGMSNEDITNMLSASDHVSISVLQGDTVKVFDVKKAVLTPQEK